MSASPPEPTSPAQDDLVPIESGALRPKVSVVVTTFNEEHNIAACLDTLLWADEILVIDSFSEDKTPEIVQSYDEVTFIQRTYFGSAAQKNWAMDQCKHPWLLIFDADERCTPELRKEMEELLASNPEHEAYTIRRKVFFLGKVINYSGWQRDQVVRLVKQGAGRYPNRRVHADMKTRGPAPLLKHRMDHYMVDDFHEYVLRIVKYSRWGAAQGWREGKRPGFNEVCLRSVWRFVRTYLLQGGIFDGMRGIVFCMLQAYGTYVKWSLLWSWRVNEERGMEPKLPVFDESEETWQGLEELS